MENGVFEKLNKLYEKNGFVNMGENPIYPVKLKTGRPSMDYLTDGGIPRGRVILIAGEKSSGKSSASIQMCGELFEKILYIDTEYTLTTDYLVQLGVDPNKFYHAIPESTEKMMNLMRENIANFDCIIVDSINNSASEEQLQKSAEDRTMANRAIVLGTQLPIITGLANRYGTTIVVVSQIRENMEKTNKYSADFVIPGGQTLKHNSSMTLEFKPATKKKSKETDEMDARETITGRMIRIHCSKNKVGTPLRTIEMEFTYGKGYTKEADIAATALRLGIFEKAGSWVKYKGESICQGADNLVQTLMDNPELFEEVRKQLDL